MERFKHFALIVLIALTSLTASAYDFKVDGIYYNVLSKEDLTCEVTFYNSWGYSYSGDIVIPSSVTNNAITYNVTSIGEKAFYKCSDLTSVTIPNSVTSIGEEAFYGCTSLPVENNLRYADTYLVGAVDRTQITYTIKNGVKWIGNNAFSNCSYLTSVDIPNSVTSIGSKAFYGCSSLTSVTIPNSVTSIGKYAFYECTSLTSVTFSNSVTSIGEEAFSGCTGLTSIVIPNSVTSIGESAFCRCSSLESFSGKFATEDHRCLIVDGVLNSVAPVGLTSYTIPNSVTTICDYAFYGCSSLTSVEIPNSVTTIGGCAFEDCTRLTSVEIPNSVTSIGMYAFKHCSSLTSLVIGNSVTSIQYETFCDCSSLTSVVIGSSVTKIGGSAFFGCHIIYATFSCAPTPTLATEISDYYLKEITLQENLTHFLAYPFNKCSNLTKLTSLATEPLTLTKAQFTDSQFETLEVIVPDEALEKYMVADVWKEFKNLRGVNIKDVEVNTCGNPVLSIVEGQLKIELSTEGSKCKYSITTTDTKSGDVESGTSISLSGEYEITAYAYAEGYKNSETITATLVWVNPTLEGSTDVISMEATKAVLIRSNGNGIVISGTEYGERVDLYDISGNLINTKVADDGETIIPCNTNKGEIIVVKYGDKAVKCRI